MRTYFGSVDDLIGNNNVSWSDFFAEGSNGGEGDDGLDTESLESGDVGSRVDGGRRNGVIGRVSRNEGDEDFRRSGSGSGKGSNRDGRRGRSPRLSTREKSAREGET